MSLNPPKVKSVWAIAPSPASDEPDWWLLFDGAGKYVLKSKSRMELADHAFDHGADEIKHDYDLLVHR